MSEESSTKQQQELALKKMLKSMPLYVRELWQECLTRNRELFNYRDILIKEGDARQYGYILLTGSVTLTRTTRDNGTIRRRLIAEVSGLDLLGADCIFEDDPQQFYTHTVSSSQAVCIRVSQEEITQLAVLFNLQSIRERQQRRRTELTKESRRETQSMKRLPLQNKQLELLKMQLPEIKMKHQSSRRSTKSTRQKKPKLFDEIITLPKQHLRTLVPSPQKSQPISQSPDRLFKQNLKNIIRRKISYQTRQFAVLKFFRRAELNEKVPQTANNPEQHIPEGSINRFFNLEGIQ